MHVQKILFSQKGEIYYLTDLTKDYHCTYGFIRADVLQKAAPGDVLTTSQDKKLTIADATFLDNYVKMKRQAQVIAQKECGAILSTTLVGKDAVCVDAGGGSGWLTCFLARYVKKVHVFDIREDHIELVLKNADRLELTNVVGKVHDVYTGIPVKKADLITFDLPEPWQALPHAYETLVPGGFLVCYVPSVTQMHEVIKHVDTRDFIVSKCVELIEREWDVDKRRARPSTHNSIHTGFLLFLRKNGS